MAGHPQARNAWLSQGDAKAVPFQVGYVGHDAPGAFPQIPLTVLAVECGPACEVGHPDVANQDPSPDQNTPQRGHKRAWSSYVRSEVPPRGASGAHGCTRIFTAVSLCSIRVRRPSETKSSNAIRPVMNGFRSILPAWTSLTTASWSRTYAMVPRRSISLSTNFCMSTVAGWPQIDTLTMTPAGRTASSRRSSSSLTPAHSNPMSAPTPSVSLRTSSLTSWDDGSSTWSA